MTKKASQQTSKRKPGKQNLSKTTLSDFIGECIKLHKVGINWFGKCPFCQDPGSHFCVPNTQDKFVCFRCSVTGDLEAFKTKWGGVWKINQTDLITQIELL